MSRRGVTLPLKCENCVNYEQRVVGRRESVLIKREQRQQRKQNGGRRLEFAAPSFQHSAAVVADAPRVNGDAQLQPGAHREVEQNRAETLYDVLAHGARGLLVGGAGLCLGGVLVLIWPDLPSARTVAVCGLTFTFGGILVSVFQPQDIIIAKIEEWLERDIDGDGQIGTVHYVIEGTLRDESGNETYLKFILESEGGNRKWHNFCRAVLYSRRNFSENEAKRHGLSGKDWSTILQTFAAQQWVRRAKQRGTPKLRGMGWQWVKHYADHPPASDGTALTFAEQV